MSRSWSWQALRYLLVSHIPFMRTSEAGIVLDHLWARDLEGLSASIGPVRIIAPELPLRETLGSWGPTSTTISSKGRLSFVGLPAITSCRDGWQWPRIRSILRAEVNQADLVHSSNLFPPMLGCGMPMTGQLVLGRRRSSSSPKISMTFASNPAMVRQGIAGYDQLKTLCAGPPWP
jgi:hypothetical protein